MNYIKKFGIYSGVTFFSSALMAGFTMLIANILTPSEYGKIEIFRTALALLTGVIIFGANTLVFGNYYKFNKIEFGDFLSTSLYLMVLFVMVILILLNIFPSIQFYLSNKIFISSISLIFLMALIQALNSLNLSLYQIKGEAYKFAIFTGTTSIFTVVTSLILIIKYNQGWMGLVYGILYTSLFMLIPTILNFKSYPIRFKPRNNYLKFILISGFPLIISHIGGWVNEGIDKFMLSSLVDNNTVGVYSLGYRFGTVMMLVQIATLRAWVPFFYKNIEESKKKAKIVKYSYLLILAFLIVALIISLIGPFLLEYFFTESYFEATKFIYIICFAYVFDGIWKLFSAYLVVKNKTKVIAVILVISAIVNIGLNYLLIGKFGMIGAAWATFFSFFTGAILTIIFSQQNRTMPWFYLLKK